MRLLPIAANLTNRYISHRLEAPVSISRWHSDLVATQTGKKINMKKLIGLIVLGITLCTAVSGCVVVPARGYYAPHPYYYR
jgi:hypothetical protein